MGLLAAGWALAGVAAVRLLGLALARGEVGSVTWVALALEVPGTVIAFWAAGQLARG